MYAQGHSVQGEEIILTYIFMNCEVLASSYFTWRQSHAIKKKWANKINADHLHCGDKGLTKGQQRPKS